MPSDCLDVYFQNVRGLRTKRDDFYDNVFPTNHKIIRLTEARLLDSVFSHIFLSNYKVFRVTRVYDNVIPGPGVLTAISQPVSGATRRFDLELINESKQKVKFEIF
jgi:hypothetical protein